MGGIFSKPKPPAIKPPAPMPVQDDAAIQEAKKKKQAAAQKSSGRQSTILTDFSSDKLGS
jgi:hypothetical protein